MTQNIQDIAPLLSYHFIDIELDSKALEKYNKLLVDNSIRIGLFHKYLGQLHDSGILKTNISDTTFSITLNDFTTHIFSDVLIEKQNLNIKHSKRIFPLQLDFEVNNLTFNTIDSNGNLQIIAATNIDEYLYEQIITIEDKEIELGIVAWKKGSRNVRGQYIILLMNVKNINVRELQDKAWIELFGNTYNDYYKYFKAELDGGRYLSDLSSCTLLYEEYQKLFEER